MLLKTTQEPLAAISKETRHAEESLFIRLMELARNRPFLLDCSVQQLADDEFVAVLSDHDSGAEVCAWSGAASMASSSNSKPGSTGNTRVLHVPPPSVMRKLPRTLRAIQQGTGFRSRAIMAFRNKMTPAHLAHSVLSRYLSG